MTNEIEKRLSELEKCYPFRLIRIEGANPGNPNSGKKPIDFGWQQEVNQGDYLDVISELKRYSGLNFAIPAGQCQGFNLVVIDEDIANGKCGDQSRADLELELGSLPITWEVVTGSGGRHYYYALPDGVNVKNNIGFRPGLDIKSGGGYVVAPGSIHYSGGMYRWVDGRSPVEIDIAILPDAWVSAIAKPVREKKIGVTISGGSKFRSMSLYSDLEASVYFPGALVTKTINKFFNEVALTWKKDNPRNLPWIDYLFRAASDAERLKITIEDFTSAASSVAPLGYLTDVDVHQIYRGYLKGSVQSLIFEKNKNNNKTINGKGVSHE